MASRPLKSALAVLFLVAPFAAAQACGPRGPDLASRMAQTRQIAEGFGYKATGPAENGTLEESKEKKVAIALKEGCYQVFAYVGDGLKGIELTLQDPAGKSVGTVVKQEGQSSVKHCVTEGGTYTLVLKPSAGAGAYVVETYASNQTAPTGPKDPDGPTPCTGPDCDDDPNMVGGGGGMDDCEAGRAPELTVGSTTKGSTSGKQGMLHWSCAAGDGPAGVYRLKVDGRHKLVIDMTAKFDAVMALTRAASSDGYLCDSSSELECADDSDGVTNKGHIEAVVDTGEYGILVGGYDGERGEYEIKTRLEDAPSLDTFCSAARAITPGVKQSDVIGGAGSNFHASCAAADGDEVLYKLDLKSRSRLRLTAKSSAGDAILSMRGRCEDPASETICTNMWRAEGVSWSGMMSAGNYTVIADTSDPTRSGTMDVMVDTAPDGGAGTADGDTCKDLKPFPVSATSSSVTVDTFFAKADLKATCAADGGSDVAYKLEIKSKTKLYITASTSDDEGRHVVAIQKTCGETKGEVVCESPTASKGSSGMGVEATLDPGMYYVIVKGKGSDDFGRIRLNVKARDLAPAIAACKAAPKLVSGTAVSDTTSAQPDKFASPGCGGTLNYQNSGDRVYQFTVKDRSHVNITFKGNPFYNAILSLRSDCNDPTKGEITCSTYYAKVIDRDVDPGTYYVVVDGYGNKSEGAYTLEMTAKSIK